MLVETHLKTGSGLLNTEKYMLQDERRKEENTWSSFAMRMKDGFKSVEKMSMWVSVKDEEECWIIASGMMGNKIGEIAVLDNWGCDWYSTWWKEMKIVEKEIKRLAIVCIAPDAGMDRIGMLGKENSKKGPMGYEKKRKSGEIGGAETLIRLLNKSGGVVANELTVMSVNERKLGSCSVWYGSCLMSGETATAWQIASFFLGVYARFALDGAGPARMNVVNCKAIKGRSDGVLAEYAMNPINVACVMHGICHATEAFTLDRTLHLHQELLNLTQFARNRDELRGNATGPTGSEFGLSNFGDPVIRMSPYGIQTEIMACTMRFTLELCNNELGRLRLWKCLLLPDAQNNVKDQSDSDHSSLAMGPIDPMPISDECDMPRVYEKTCSVEWSTTQTKARSLREVYLI